MWWVFRIFTQLLDIQSTYATSQPGSHAQRLSVGSTHTYYSAAHRLQSITVAPQASHKVLFPSTHALQDREREKKETLN